jgi:hypothetical protein
MKKPQHNKLSVNRETLRALGHNQLGHAIGGAIATSNLGDCDPPTTSPPASDRCHTALSCTHN